MTRKLASGFIREERGRDEVLSFFEGFSGMVVGKNMNFATVGFLKFFFTKVVGILGFNVYIVIMISENI